MSESDAVGAVSEPQVDPVSEEVVADKGEGTTPEEVAKVLNLPVDKSAVDDGEEGDDPDAVIEPADGEEDEPDETAEEDSVDEEEVEPEKPLSPDEATSDDKYSFQIEDANGTTFKIVAGTSLEEQLGEDFELKNQAQAIDIMRQLDKLEAQKSTDEAKVAEDATKQERREAASKLLTGWQEEAKALTNAKRIPEGKEGEDRIDTVYKFMADENTARQKAGKPTLNSFEDALDKLENKEARDKVVADAKAAKETARKNGALVGGSSAASTSGGPIYRAGTAKNANQAIRSLGLLE